MDSHSLVTTSKRTVADPAATESPDTKGVTDGVTNAVVTRP